MSQRIPMHRKRRDGLHSASPNSPLPSSPSPVSGGQSLDRHTQSQMSARFGHDFSSVRIHTNARAQETAAEMGADAYALGSDIAFGEGQYTPGSPTTERLLAHELTHVVQQAQGGPGDPNRPSRKSDESEREAQSAADRVLAGESVSVEAAPQAAVARTENDEGSSWLGSLASSAWSETKAAAGAVYNGYEKATDFKALESGSKDPATLKDAKGKFGESFVTGGINGEIDSLEKSAAAGNQKMVDDSKGHWYEGLAEGAAWMNNGMTQATGGLVKGGLDVGLGMVNAVAHPIDAAAGLEGIAEHDLPMVGSVLKTGHALYDLAAKDKPEERQYGSSLGEIANHILNPMQQMQDDQSFNTNLAAGILAPDEVGKKDANGKPIEGGQAIVNAFKDKPIEATTRAITNIVPFFLGGGEAEAAKVADVGDVAKVSDAGGAAKVLDRPALPTPEPPTVLEPHPFEAAPNGELKPVTPAPAEFPVPDKPALGEPSGLETDPHSSPGAEPLDPHTRAFPEPEPAGEPADKLNDYEALKRDLARQEREFGQEPATRKPRPAPDSVYIPDDPLEMQRVKGVDLPKPLPEAEGRPHTALGGRTGTTDGVRYRQSATFNGESWPKAGGLDVPEGRVDWYDHGRGDHTTPHIHEFTYDGRQYRSGSQKPWWPQGSGEIMPAEAPVSEAPVSQPQITPEPPGSDPRMD